MNIHLIHTNDIHSHFEEYVPLAASIRALRERLQAQGEAVLLFDIGDHVDRMRAETDGTLGLANAALLRELAVDGFVFGNNEGLTLPLSAWETFCREASLPVLVANLVQKDDLPFPFFHEYFLYTVQGVRVGVFGLTAPYTTYYEKGGVHVLEPEACAARMVRLLKEKGADLIVLLSHLGLQADRRMALHVSGIDVILGSHSHHVLPHPERIGQTWIAQAGKYGQYFGHTTVDFDVHLRAVRQVTGTVCVNGRRQKDERLAKVLGEWREIAEQRLSQVVAQLSYPLFPRIQGESPLSNLLVDELRSLTGAEIAFVNTGTLLSPLGPGSVTKGMLLQCCPSPTRPIVVRYTGEDLWRIFNKSLRPEYFGRIGYGFGFRGREIGTLAVSGVTWELDHDGQLRKVRIGDRLLQGDRWYACATVDYLTLSGVYEEAKKGHYLDHVSIFLRELLERALRDPQALRTAHIPRRIRKGKEQ